MANFEILLKTFLEQCHHVFRINYEYDIVRFPQEGIKKLQVIEVKRYAFKKKININYGVSEITFVNLNDIGEVFLKIIQLLVSNDENYFGLFCGKKILSTTIQLLKHHDTLCNENFQIQLLKGLCLLYYNIKDSSQLCGLNCFVFKKKYNIAADVLLSNNIPNKVISWASTLNCITHSHASIDEFTKPNNFFLSNRNLSLLFYCKKKDFIDDKKEEYDEDQEKEDTCEVISWLVSFLKTISYHVTKKSLNLFYNSSYPHFPLLLLPVQFLNHTNHMVQSHAKFIILTLLQSIAQMEFYGVKIVPYYFPFLHVVDSHSITRFIKEHSNFVRTLIQYWIQTWSDIQTSYNKVKSLDTHGASVNSLRQRVVNHFFLHCVDVENAFSDFLGDLFDLKKKKLTKMLVQEILKQIINILVAAFRPREKCQKKHLFIQDISNPYSLSCSVRNIKSRHKSAKPVLAYRLLPLLPYNVLLCEDVVFFFKKNLVKKFPDYFQASLFHELSFELFLWSTIKKKKFPLMSALTVFQHTSSILKIEFLSKWDIKKTITTRFVTAVYLRHWHFYLKRDLSQISRVIGANMLHQAAVHCHFDILMTFVILWCDHMHSANNKQAFHIKTFTSLTYGSDLFILLLYVIKGLLKILYVYPWVLSDDHSVSACSLMTLLQYVFLTLFNKFISKVHLLMQSLKNFHKVKHEAFVQIKICTSFFLSIMMRYFRYFDIKLFKIQKKTSTQLIQFFEKEKITASLFFLLYQDAWNSHNKGYTQSHYYDIRLLLETIEKQKVTFMETSNFTLLFQKPLQSFFTLYDIRFNLRSILAICVKKLYDDHFFVRNSTACLDSKWISSLLVLKSLQDLFKTSCLLYQNVNKSVFLKLTNFFNESCYTFHLTASGFSSLTCNPNSSDAFLNEDPLLTYSKDLWNDLIKSITFCNRLPNKLLPIIYHYVTSRYFLEKSTKTQYRTRYCNIWVRLYKVLFPSYALSSQFYSNFSNNVHYQKSLTFCYLKKSCILASLNWMIQNLSKLQNFNIPLPLHLNDTLKELTHYKLYMLPSSSIQCEPGKRLFKIRLVTQKISENNTPLSTSVLLSFMTKWRPQQMMNTLAQTEHFVLVTSNYLLCGSHFEGNQLKEIIYRIPLYSIVFCSMCTDKSCLLHIDFFIHEKDPCQTGYNSLVFIGYLSKSASCEIDQKQVETCGQNTLPVVTGNVSIMSQKYLTFLKPFLSKNTQSSASVMPYHFTHLSQQALCLTFKSNEKTSAIKLYRFSFFLENEAQQHSFQKYLQESFKVASNKVLHQINKLFSVCHPFVFCF